MCVCVWGGGGGGCYPLLADLISVGGGGCCPLLADSTRGGGGGGHVPIVILNSLTFIRSFGGGGGGGGGGGAIQSRREEPMRHQFFVKVLTNLIL